LTKLDRPPPPTARAWTPVFERWIVSVVAPSFEPIDAAALSGSRAAIQRAMAANAAGSRVEREALRKAQKACGTRRASKTAPADATKLCLAPLSDETLAISPTRGD
jgi:hypothetical protein